MRVGDAHPALRAAPAGHAPCGGNRSTALERAFADEDLWSCMPCSVDLAGLCGTVGWCHLGFSALVSCWHGLTVPHSHGLMRVAWAKAVLP